MRLYWSLGASREEVITPALIGGHLVTMSGVQTLEWNQVQRDNVSPTLNSPWDQLN